MLKKLTKGRLAKVLLTVFILLSPSVAMAAMLDTPYCGVAGPCAPRLVERLDFRTFSTITLLSGSSIVLLIKDLTKHLQPTARFSLLILSLVLALLLMILTTFFFEYSIIYNRPL